MRSKTIEPGDSFTPPKGAENIVYPDGSAATIRPGQPVRLIAPGQYVCGSLTVHVADPKADPAD